MSALKAGWDAASAAERAEFIHEVGLTVLFDHASHENRRDFVHFAANTDLIARGVTPPPTPPAEPEPAA